MEDNRNVVDYLKLQNNGKLGPLFRNIRRMGIPSELKYWDGYKAWCRTGVFQDQTWRQIEIKQVTSFLGFTSDWGGKPTSLWHDFRGPDYRKILGKAIQKSYAAIYNKVKNPLDCDQKDLVDAFKLTSTASERDIHKMIATFKALCSHADFSGVTATTTPAKKTPVAAKKTAPAKTTTKSPAKPKTTTPQTTKTPKPEKVVSEPEQYASHGVKSIETAMKKLQKHLSTDQERNFREALICIENGAYNAAYVVAWAAFMDLLISRLASDGLVAIHRELPKWKKDVSNTDDLRSIPEKQLIDAGKKIGILKRGEDRILDGLLQERNECAHAGGPSRSMIQTLGYVDKLIEKAVDIRSRTPKQA